MAQGVTYLCGVAAAIYITTCLVVAAVRWFHMCHPYDEHPAYYYPGRPYVIGVYLSSLFLIPYVVQPGSTDAWYLCRIFFLPVAIFHFTILLLAYFLNESDADIARDLNLTRSAVQRRRASALELMRRMMGGQTK